MTIKTLSKTVNPFLSRAANIDCVIREILKRVLVVPELYPCLAALTTAAKEESN